jgi:hypothetical protein
MKDTITNLHAKVFAGEGIPVLPRRYAFASGIGASS